VLTGVDGPHHALRRCGELVGSGGLLRRLHALDNRGGSVPDGRTGHPGHAGLCRGQNDGRHHAVHRAAHDDHGRPVRHGRGLRPACGAVRSCQGARGRRRSRLPRGGPPAPAPRAPHRGDGAWGFGSSCSLFFVLQSARQPGPLRGPLSDPRGPEDSWRCLGRAAAPERGEAGWAARRVRWGPPPPLAY
jgi:hypothetical protein